MRCCSQIIVLETVDLSPMCQVAFLRCVSPNTERGGSDLSQNEQTEKEKRSLQKKLMKEKSETEELRTARSLQENIVQELQAQVRVSF